MAKNKTSKQTKTSLVPTANAASASATPVISRSLTLFTGLTAEGWQMACISNCLLPSPCGRLTSLPNSTWLTEHLPFPQTCSSCCPSCLTKRKLQPSSAQGQNVGLSLSFLFPSHPTSIHQQSYPVCLTLLQPPGPPGCPSNTPGAVLPQDLCTGCVVCLKTLLPDLDGAHSQLFLLLPNVTFSMRPSLASYLFIWLCRVLVEAHGLLSRGMHVGRSSLTRDQTQAPCIGSVDS